MDIDRAELPKYDEADSIKLSWAVEQAEKSGLSIVFPASNELQLDIDDWAGLGVLADLTPLLEKHWGPVTRREHTSKSDNPKKRHVTLTLEKPLTDLERIALQACLGSDRKRELLSLVRVKIGDPHPTLFYERGKK